jgi:hypothetical protein
MKPDPALFYIIVVISFALESSSFRPEKLHKPVHYCFGNGNFIKRNNATHFILVVWGSRNVVEAQVPPSMLIYYSALHKSLFVHVQSSLLSKHIFFGMSSVFKKKINEILHNKKSSLSMIRLGVKSVQLRLHSLAFEILVNFLKLCHLKPLTRSDHGAKLLHTRMVLSHVPESQGYS